MALQTPVFRTTAQNCAKSTINISARPRRRLGYYNMKAKQTNKQTNNQLNKQKGKGHLDDRKSS